MLFEASRDGNALHALKLERQCIAVEQYLKETDSDILDKQLSRSGEAELSLKLVRDPKAYREHVESIFPNGIRGIPQGDGMYIPLSTVRYPIWALGNGTFRHKRMPERNTMPLGRQI